MYCCAIEKMIVLKMPAATMQAALTGEGFHT
jgi:hypothetical protein